MSEQNVEKTESTEKSETTIEKPALPDPAEEKRVETPHPVERTESTTETTTEAPADNR